MGGQKQKVSLAKACKMFYLMNAYRLLTYIELYEFMKFVFLGLLME
jgi:hypothetical protein